MPALKITENKKTIALVDRLSEINEVLKALAEEQSTIKADLKALMVEMETNVLGAGKYLLVINDKVRTDLNKQGLKILLGDKYENFLTKTSYQTFEVKKA